MGNVPTKREQCQTCLGNAERAEQVTKAKPKGNVPNLRFPEFSGEWKKCTIDDLCEEFKSGKNIKADNILNEGEYPVFGGNGLRGYTDCYNHEGDYVLIGRQGALCGNIRFVTGKTYITEHAIAAKATNNNNTRFLESLFIQLNLGKFSDQSAQPGLAVNKLLKIETSVPSKDEQEKIASLLQNIDKRIATQNKIIEDLKKLKSAISLNVLHSDTWEQFKIKDIARIGRGRVISYIEISQQKNPTYPVYSSQTSNDGIMGYLDDYMFEGEYISWTTDGANAGTVFYRNGKFNCTNVCGLLKLRKDFDAHFVSLILAEATKKYVSINLANPKLMNNTMGNIQIRLPKLEEQKRISIVFRVLQELCTVHNSLLTEYTKQKQYLLSQMFI